MSMPRSLAKIKETRGNAKCKNILCDVDLTNDDLQNEDYSYTPPSNSETGIGVLDRGSAKEAERNVSNKRGKYIKYSAVQRYEIGKYASEYSAASTLQKYKGEFTQLKESTVLGCGRNRKGNFVSHSRKNENQRLNCLPQDVEDH